MKLTDYLGDKPFWRVTVKLAVPVALQNVLTSSFQLVDTLMVSQLGDVTLSAVGMAAQWGWLCGLLGFGLCSGMSVFISQYWGVKDLKGIRRVMGIGLMLAMFVSLGFLAVALAAPTWVLGLFNQDPAVVETGCRYLRIVCFSYPAVRVTYLLSNVLRGTERVRLPLYVSIVTTIANAFVRRTVVDLRRRRPSRASRSRTADATSTSTTYVVPSSGPGRYGRYVRYVTYFLTFPSFTRLETVLNEPVNRPGLPVPVRGYRRVRPGFTLPVTR